MLWRFPASLSLWLAERFATQPERPVQIETSRLLLRELEESDAPAVLAYTNDPEINRYGDPFIAMSVADTQFVIRCARKELRRRRRAYHRLGVQEAQSGRLIGDCCLIARFRRVPSSSPYMAIIGFQVHREYWGRGYATEALRALIGFGFREVGIMSVVGGCHPENHASRRVMEKAGLVYQGTQDAFPGGPVDVESLVFAADRVRWLAQIENQAAEDFTRQNGHNPHGNSDDQEGPE
jgi:ribosomal-protein-alanine N-acetyltransferase